MGSDRSLARIVATAEALQINVEGGTEHLWGFCRGCEYAAACRGGCSWTAHTFFGRPGNNPYCHHRALTLARRGRRERLVWAKAAPGQPFDYGLFELVEEPVDSPWPEGDPLHDRIEGLGAVWERRDESS